MQSEFFLAEFKGTYRAPHPAGIRTETIIRDFHVKVTMLKKFLAGDGLNGAFQVYYKGFLKNHYPDMINTYQFDLVEATELDGTKIDNPRCLSYQGLLDYIANRRYPINAMLYSALELRDEIILYEKDPKGQQHLQGKRENLKGNVLSTAAELGQLPNVMVKVDSSAASVAPAQMSASVVAAAPKSGKGKSLMEQIT